MLVEKTSGFFEEFKRFAVKGNAFELAIAVVIGNAFSGVVNSLVADIITPFIAFITNDVDLKTLSYAPRADLIITYGAFLQALFNFLIISFSIFLVFKLVSVMRRRLFTKKEEAKVPEHEKSAEVKLLEEIRDVLKAKS